MKLMVTGAGGSWASARALPRSKRSPGDRPAQGKLDVTHYSQVLEAIGNEKPDLVIHCAAYTKVDQAESEPGLAYLINGYGTENIAVACAKHNVPMLYVSSDYVFDGEQNTSIPPGSVPPAVGLL